MTYGPVAAGNRAAPWAAGREGRDGRPNEPGGQQRPMRVLNTCGSAAAAPMRSKGFYRVGDTGGVEADMNGNRQQRVLVGVDGSAASLAALRWAADEARLRQSPLQIVGAWDPATHSASYADVGGPATRAELEVIAGDAFSAATRTVFGPRLPDGVTAELAEGAPERILVARSADVGLLVLGATSRPWPGEWFAGPVIRACLAHASCPVVVIGSDAGTSVPASQDAAGYDRGLAAVIA
jgi:nucleotide-binding universal stress UspA family protein